MDGLFTLRTLLVLSEHLSVLIKQGSRSLSYREEIMKTLALQMHTCLLRQAEGQ